MTHHVRIGKMTTHCRFRADTARKGVLRHAVDTTCRSRLDGALQRVLPPVLDGHDGVIRIRQIDLTLTSVNPLDGRLAQDIAARIAARIRAHLGAKKVDGVQSWPDHAHYIAHFVLWRLGLRAGSDWAFADFAALLHLSGQQAAVEVLGARPQALAVLAQDSFIRAAPDIFVRAFDENMAVALMRQISLTEDPAGVCRALALLQALPDTLGPVRNLDRAGPLATAALAVALDILAALPQIKATAVPQEAALLARLVVAVASLHAFIRQAKKSSWDARIVMAAGTDVPHAAAALLSRVADAPDGPELLSRVAEAIDAAAPGTAQPAKVHLDQKQEAQQLNSRFAGLALLMPGLARLSQGHTLVETHLHDIALAALPDDMRQIARRDAGVLQLFPRNPQDPPAVDWPQPDVTGLPAHLITARNGAGLWAQAAMAHFADRLPGLSQSSEGYLRHQFLIRSGEIVATPDMITVVLDKVPLGIVLSMGGHLGLRGRVWWLGDRPLTITIRGGV